MKTISCALCRAALPLLLDAETDVSAQSAGTAARGEAAPAELAQHLAGCPDCARELALLRAVRDSSRSLGEIAAPAALRLNVRAALQAEATAAADRAARGTAWSRWQASRRTWQPAFAWSSGVALAAFALFASTRTTQAPITIPVEETRSEAPVAAAAPAGTDARKKSAAPSGSTKSAPAVTSGAARSSAPPAQSPASASTAPASSALTSPAAPPPPDAAAGIPHAAVVPGTNGAFAPQPKRREAAPAQARNPFARTDNGRADSMRAKVPAAPALPERPSQPSPAAPAPRIVRAVPKTEAAASGGGGAAAAPRLRNGRASTFSAGAAFDRPVTGPRAKSDDTRPNDTPREAAAAPAPVPAPVPATPAFAAKSIDIAPRAPAMAMAPSPMMADAVPDRTEALTLSRANNTAPTAALAVESSPRQNAPVRLALLPREHPATPSVASGAVHQAPQLNKVPVVGNLFENRTNGPAGPQGPQGPQGPAVAARADEDRPPLRGQLRDKERGKLTQRTAPVPGGPFSTFGWRASGKDGTVGERGSSWRARPAAENEKPSASASTTAGNRNDGEKRGEEFALSQTFPSKNASGGAAMGDATAGGAATTNGFAAPAGSGKLTYYGALPPMTAGANLNGATFNNAVAPLLTSEVRRAMLVLSPPRTVQNAKVCIVIDGLEFPEAQAGVLWRGDVTKDTELVLKPAIRALRAGTVRARITLETADGTILSAGTVELFAAP